ncbi:MAG: hypothetical protein KKC84_01910, partial [Candidatus Omnitrophica bacterium]|nr:hypothetical protein [Candidatus Omnitrophota bacterium]
MKKRIFWIYALSSAVYFTQGIEGLPSQGVFYYLKDTLKFPAEKIMYISTITVSAWLIKPFIGFLIDNLFSKKTWIYISLVLDILVVLVLGLVSLPLALIVVLLVSSSTNAAFRDVSVDGIMCVEGKRYNSTGKIQSVQWIAISVSGLITGVAGGFLAQKGGYRLAFLCLVPVYILVGLIAYLYKEDANPGGNSVRTSWADL